MICNYFEDCYFEKHTIHKNRLLQAPLFRSKILSFNILHQCNEIDLLFSITYITGNNKAQIKALT